ncbi:nuclear transport factor 2 family protein [Rhodococcus hoagii]|nr:nuclear transport factor 2 family protein [Prescottella equi]
MNEQRSEWADRQQIHDVVLRYCRGIDRLDFDLVRSAYHRTESIITPGSRAPWTSTSPGSSPSCAPRRGGTMHMVGNHLVELLGDTASARRTGRRFTGVSRRRSADEFHQRRAVHRPHGMAGRSLGHRRAVGPREWTRSDAGGSCRRRAPDRPQQDGDDPLIQLQRRLYGAEARA